jgi:hypothetical protein
MAALSIRIGRNELVQATLPMDIDNARENPLQYAEGHADQKIIAELAVQYAQV